jgi:acylphosphatase
MVGKSTAQARVHAVVHGYVQGVNFRYYATRAAWDLDLSGWIANRRDGTVETIAEGRRSDLEEFLDFLHQGSPSALVQGVDVEWDRPTGEFDGFRVRYL